MNEAIPLIVLNYKGQFDKGNKHQHVREIYIRLCSSCHRRYDNKLIKI